MYCTECGTKNPDDAQWCCQCGARLRQSEEISADSAEEVSVGEAAVEAENQQVDTEALEAVAPTEALDAERPTQRLENEQATRIIPGEDRPTYAPTTVMPQQMPSSAPRRAYDPGTTAEMPATASAAEFRQASASASTSSSGKMNPRTRTIIIIVAIVVALAAIVGGTYMAQLWGGKTVPDVTGQSVDAALAELQDQGFTVKTSDIPADDNIGLIVSTDPASGKRAGFDNSVTLEVGVARIVPEVSGLSEADARAALAAVGAQNVQVAYQASTQTEGAVIAVSPTSGATFKSTDAITLTVAQPCAVPDVVGKSQDDATAAVKAQGLQVKIVWAESDQPTGTVLSASPATGTNMTPGTTVTLTVASPGARDIYHLMDYFTASPQNVSAYLQWKGWTVTLGESYSGVAEETWANPEQTASLTFTKSPYSHHHVGLGRTDVLASGATVAGVRLVISANSSLSLGSTLTQGTVSTYMNACGFDNMLDSCTQDDNVLPSGTKRTSSPQFIVANGETGGYAWTIMPRINSSSNTVVITCAPKSLYSDLNIAKMGFSSVCDFVAYSDNYTE